jgi:TatD DNase family protein
MGESPMPLMIDSHCHLTDPRLGDQLDDVLNRAQEAGVSRLITIGTDIEDDMAAIAVCRNRDNIRCAIGIHPNHSADADLSQVALLRGLHTNPSVLALGEMGLDYHYDRAPRDHQRKIFEAQLQIAHEVQKPVVIHCRDAVDDTLDVLREFAKVPALFHCFTGTLSDAEKILAAGYFLGFTGPVTYKKNDELREVVRLTPLDRLMVETDAPYLTPEPVRKIKTNEPAFVMHTARAIADLKQLDLAEFDRITTRNVAHFFKWLW